MEVLKTNVFESDITLLREPESAQSPFYRNTKTLSQSFSFQNPIPPNRSHTSKIVGHLILGENLRDLSRAWLNPINSCYLCEEATAGRGPPWKYLGI
jgi:hypothetical protein